MASRTRKARSGSVESFMSNVNRLIAENERLTRENAALRSTLTRVNRMTAEGVPVGRRGRGASATPRRKITDPGVLERRRAALAKAREVRAANRQQERRSA